MEGKLGTECQLPGTEVCMVQVKYIDDLDGWIVATKKDGRDLSAQFYHTTDGGKTFAVEEVGSFRPVT